MPRPRCPEGDHTWYSSFASKFNPGDVVIYDWCVRCGDPNPDIQPHIFHDGQRRRVDDVESPEGLL